MNVGVGGLSDDEEGGVGVKGTSESNKGEDVGVIMSGDDGDGGLSDVDDGSGEEKDMEEFKLAHEISILLLAHEIYQFYCLRIAETLKFGNVVTVIRRKREGALHCIEGIILHYISLM